MSHKVIGSLLLVVSLACIALFVIGSLGSDKTPPEISFPEDNLISYSEGDSQSVLLLDVVASDSQDGDVSDNLVIESVYDFNNGSAKVVYAARDNSGNISKAERIVSYQKSDETASKQAVDISPSGEQIDALASSDGPLVPDGEKPVLRLTVSKTVIKVGDDSFNKISFVDDIADDKDERTQLFRRIMVKGDYDVHVPGSYSLEYRVTDSDGNVSEPAILTLIVEEDE